MLYYRPLCLYAISLLECVDDAEDIVMDCFVKLWNRNKTGAIINDVKSYLYLMVRNACYDDNKKKGKIPEFVDVNLVDAESNLDDNERFTETAANLWTAIDTLPKQCRRIFLMSKRDGMKYSEIAEKLGLSIKTVEVQIGKAYKVLRGKAKDIYSYFFSLLA